jgi:hypothetical protein
MDPSFGGNKERNSGAIFALAGHVVVAGDVKAALIVTEVT